MTENVDDFLAGYGLGDSAVAHANTRTIKDIFDEMSAEDKDFQALIVGAAVDGASLADAPEVIEQYNALSEERKNLIDFLVGNIIAEDNLKHAAMDVENFLSHYGVKGMKWGVIRDRINPPGSLNRSSANTAEGRAAARGKVKLGTASKKEEHLAALKSTGHRAINAFTGDKTFWRRMAITAGISVTAFAVPVAAAWLMPSVALGALGSLGISKAIVGPFLSTFMTNEAVGAATLGLAGGYGLLGTAGVGTAANVVGNTTRAVAGNTLLSRSYDRVSRNLADRQRTGKDRVINALKTVTGIRDQDLKHSDDLVEDFLEHHYDKTLFEAQLVEA